MLVKFHVDTFEWLSDGAQLGEEPRFDIFGKDMHDLPVVLNVNADNFDTVCAGLAESPEVFVQVPDEVLDLVLARMPVV